MLQTDESSISYAGNNSIVSPYSVPFRFFYNEDLVVIVTDATGEDIQVLGTDYTVSGADNPSGGTVLFKWAVPLTSRVTISRVIEATQLTSYEEADAFPAKSHERALDKLTMLVQQLQRVSGTSNGIGSAFRLTEASGGITAVSKKIDSVLGIDLSGNSILRDSGEMLGWLGQVGTSWADTSERLGTRGAFTGQLGVQRDNWTIYIARSTEAGDWSPFLPASGIVVSTSGVPAVVRQPAGDIVGTSEAQVLTNKTLTGAALISPTGLTKTDVGLDNVDNTRDVDKPVSNPVAAQLANYQRFSEKGAVNGYPSLDASGKIPVLQIPDAVLGASQYQGTWNAATNTPAIPTAAVGNKGWYYVVSVAGTTNISGISSWAVGDQIISNGAAWEKIANVNAVSSVNSKTGVVVINKTDVGLSNVDNTSDAAKNSAAVTLTNKIITSTANDLQIDAASDLYGNLPLARFNGGTGAASNTAWFGDGTWRIPVGTGDVSGPAISVDNEITVFNGTTGKAIKASGRQVSNIVDGPASAIADHIPQFSGTTGKLLKDGLVAPAGAIVGTTDTQTLTNKTLDIPRITVRGMQYLPSGVLVSNGQIITLATVGETVIWTFNMPANFLAVDGDALRVTVSNACSTGSTNKGIRLRFGGVNQYVLTTNTTAAIMYWQQATITRVNSTTQRWTVSRTHDAGGGYAEVSTGSLDLTVAQQLLLTIWSSGGNCNHYASALEFLPAPA